MIKMAGKYNTANIMIDEIDFTTKQQIQGFLNHPAFGNSYIAIMPDCHYGNGAVIGLTMTMNNYVIPNVIGVDIGCGMLMATFDFKEIDLSKLDDYIKKHIPSGFKINSHSCALPWTVIKVTEICEKINIDATQALRGIGSLGGGNHFIEAGLNKDGFLTITIHSGSRNFGKRVADFYQNKAKENLKLYFIKDQYKDLEFLPIHSQDGQDYIKAMKVAQDFASENRMEILNRICDFFNRDPILTKESIHNFIDDHGIIRKGATSAQEGETVIIPFNMSDGIAVCIGKGSKKYNYSAPHGAGRILSRKQAFQTLKMEDFKSKMENIFTTTATIETLDESPMAYKQMDIILENIKETVEVTDLIKPIYNFKTMETRKGKK